MLAFLEVCSITAAQMQESGLAENEQNAGWLTLKSCSKDSNTEAGGRAISRFADCIIWSWWATLGRLARTRTRLLLLKSSLIEPHGLTRPCLLLLESSLNELRGEAVGDGASAGVGAAFCVAVKAALLGALKRGSVDSVGGD